MSSELSYDAEAEKLIRTPYPGYQEPLQAVRDWVRRGGAALPAAIRVLEHLRRNHRHAIKVAQELVLAYLEDRERRPQAQQLLAQLEEEHPSLDEETLCRFGRLHREIGDAYLKAEPLTDTDRRWAAQQYEKAWVSYDKAFAIRANHYPGINRAALLLLRAWSAAVESERQTFLEQARQAAEKLLEGCPQWKAELPDDNIWLLASEAEARLLLGQWDDALGLYRKALQQPNSSVFYRESMGGEVRRLLRPLRELLHLPDDKADELRSLFPPPAPASPA